MALIAIALATVVVINAAFSFWQEQRVEQAMAVFRRSRDLVEFRNPHQCDEISNFAIGVGKLFVVHRLDDVIAAPERMAALEFARIINGG